MKKIYFILLLAIGLLTGTAATVKAEEKPVVKPDTTTMTTGIKIVPISGGSWNYTNGQLFQAITAAIPAFDNPMFVKITSDVSGDWLHYAGKSSGKWTNVYVVLYKNTSSGWYEIDPSFVPTVGGHLAFRCVGGCDTWDETGPIPLEGNNFDPAGCKNNSTSTWMVNCNCINNNSTDCMFQQYPASTSGVIEETLRTYPPQITE